MKQPQPPSREHTGVLNRCASWSFPVTHSSLLSARVGAQPKAVSQPVPAKFFTEPEIGLYCIQFGEQSQDGRFPQVTFPALVPSHFRRERLQQHAIQRAAQSWQIGRHKRGPSIRVTVTRHQLQRNRGDKEWTQSDWGKTVLAAKVVAAWQVWNFLLLSCLGFKWQPP